MDVQKRFELIKRGVEEVVTEKELHSLLEKKKSPIVYHGFEPSGTNFHIGYLIGIKKHIEFQKAGLKLKILLADFHALLNEKGSLEKIRKVAKLYEAGFAALGVNMKKADLILGSSFQLKPEYFEDVMKLSLRVRYLRAKRSMDLVGRKDDDPHVSQFLYPLMQTVDMKHLNVDIAFGDFAQRKLHMLAREELSKIGYKKTPIAIHHATMLSLKGAIRVMSSSLPQTTIMIDENPDEIKRKISNAFCPEKQLIDNTMLQICKHIIFGWRKELKIERERKYGGDISFKSYSELENAYGEGSLHPSDLKNATANMLIKILEPVRKKFSKAKVKKLKKEVEG